MRVYHVHLLPQNDLNSIYSIHISLISGVMMNVGSGYQTLGRPASLPINKQNYQRSTSNPDLATTPTTPDAEVSGYFGTILVIYYTSV